MKICLARTVLLFLIPLSLGYSHHSFPGIYDVDQQWLLKGVVNEFIFRNPHTFVVLEITSDGDTTEQWYIEMAPMQVLMGRGIDKNTIEPGDDLIVTCNPARDGVKSCGLGQKGGLYRPDDQLLYGMDPRQLHDLLNLPK